MVKFIAFSIASSWAKVMEKSFALRSQRSKKTRAQT